MRRTMLLMMVMLSVRRVATPAGGVVAGALMLRPLCCGGRTGATTEIIFSREIEAGGGTGSKRKDERDKGVS